MPAQPPLAFAVNWCHILISLVLIFHFFSPLPTNSGLSLTASGRLMSWDQDHQLLSILVGLGSQTSQKKEQREINCERGSTRRDKLGRQLGNENKHIYPCLSWV